MAHIRSEVFVREDLQSILAAIAVTATTTGGNAPSDVQFQRGFAAALFAVAVAVHIDPAELAALAGVRVVGLAESDGRQ
jgi:hypothetical protein